MRTLDYIYFSMTIKSKKNRKFGDYRFSVREMWTRPGEVKKSEEERRERNGVDEREEQNKKEKKTTMHLPSIFIENILSFSFLLEPEERHKMNTK